MDWTSLSAYSLDKRDSLLISLSLLSANSPAPLSLPLSICFFFFYSVSVFLCCKLGWRRFTPGELEVDNKAVMIAAMTVAISQY